MPEIRYISGGEELLDRIKPLWEKLNHHHQICSVDFKRWYRQFTFEMRKSMITEKSRGDDILVDLAQIAGENEIIGYCLSTIIPKNSGLEGEVDSIFVDEEYRGLHIGEELFSRTLRWFDRRKVDFRRLLVATGNEEVLEFYRKFDFYPRVIVLEQKR